MSAVASTAAPLVTISEARDNDGDELAELIASCFAEYEGCIFDRARKLPELGTIAAHFLDAGGRFWVATRDHRIMGSLGVRPLAGQRVELLKVDLAQARRCQGAAQRLVDRALGFCPRTWHRIAGRVR